MIKLLVFRHGETEWNKDGIIQGHTDVPLSDVGREQASGLRERFKEIKVDLIISSNLSRARETADIVFGEKDIETVITEDLKEFSFGIYEGKKRADMISEIGQETLDKFWSDEHMDFSFPGGEKKIDVRKRAVRAINNHIKNSNLKTVAVSTHGGVVRELLNHAATKKMKPFKVENCEMFEIQVKDEEWSF